MKETLSAVFISKECSVDFDVRQVLDILIKETKLNDIEEMYILDSESETYYLVKDLGEYSNLEEIVQPVVSEDGTLSFFDFDIQLKNGIGIFTHENITFEAPDENTLFKYLDFIFRHYHLDAQNCRQQLKANSDETVEFEIK